MPRRTIGSRALPLALACLVSVAALGACGGDDEPGSSTESTRSASENTSPTPSGSEVDCDTLRLAAEQLGLLAQFLPQIRTEEDLESQALIVDPSEQRDAMSVLRPVVLGDAAAEKFLDDLGRGLDAIEAARAGDAPEAANEVQELPGGLDNAAEWLARQVPIGDALTAVGC
jgi:hypothetical protein